MITEKQIKERAYTIWEQGGRPQGKDLEYYFRAKRMLEEQESSPSPVKEKVSPASKQQLPSVLKPIEKYSSKSRLK